MYDPIGGDFIRKYIDAPANQSVIILYGLLGGEETSVPMVPMLRCAAILHPYSMFNNVSQPDKLARGIEFVLHAIQQRLIVPNVDRVFPFSKRVDAYHYMLSNRQSGKIVVSIAK